MKVKGLAPLASKTDRIDAWVLAELCRRDFVPALWLPDPGVRAERERARYRLHLVQHRVMFKNQIHATLIAFGKPCPVSDLFAPNGRDLLARLEVPEPWHANVVAALEHVDRLDDEIALCERELRAMGADHPYVPLLTTMPGITWVLGYTVASEIGDVGRFSSQWALIEAVTHAGRHPAYRDHDERTRARLGRQRSPKVARVEVARKLAEAAWPMLTTSEPFAPARSQSALAAGRPQTEMDQLESPTRPDPPQGGDREMRPPHHSGRWSARRSWGISP